MSFWFKNIFSKKKKMKQVTAIVVGAGARGTGYSNYALDFPDRLKIVGVADPRKFYRERIAKTHHVPGENVYLDWKDAAAAEKHADCVIIGTPDILHKEPAVAFASKGYHILLEKPMAVTPEDCKEIVDASKNGNTMLAVCHVLRYAPQSQKIKEVIENGLIGDVVNIQLLEPVGFWHFAHSYVRGNWRNEEQSCFSLLAKSCHDLDLILNWMGQRRCTAVSSFGSLLHFRSENKPQGAGSRCLDCTVEKSCQWSAKKIYLNGNKGFPVNRIVEVVDIENLTEALKSGPYGRCVYECDNDVMDNQVVNLQFEGGATVNFTMVAYTEKVCARQVRIFGTKGQLTCDMDCNSISHFDFLSEHHDVIKPEVKEDAGRSHLRGHFGADFYAMDAFVSAVGNNDPSIIETGPEESLASHLLCFYAEKARRENRVINPLKEPL